MPRPLLPRVGPAALSILLHATLLAILSIFALAFVTAPPAAPPEVSSILLAAPALQREAAEPAAVPEVAVAEKAEAILEPAEPPARSETDAADPAPPPPPAEEIASVPEEGPRVPLGVGAVRAESLSGAGSVSEAPPTASGAVPASPSSPIPAGPPLPGERAFANRGAAKKRAALLRHGGSDATEAAVNLALRWLAEHQDPEGFWDAPWYDPRNPEIAQPKFPAELGKAFGEPRPEDPAAVPEWMKRRREAIAQWNEFILRWRKDHPDLNGRVAVTGLALLAFLGAGHTENDGEYREAVREGATWLASAQKPDGAFGRLVYAQAIAVFALSENRALGGGHRGAVERGVKLLLDRQNPGGGWDYYGPTEWDRNDVSITCWAVMALKSARAAGILVPDEAFHRALDFYRRSGAEASEKAFGVRYATVNKMPGTNRPAVEPHPGAAHNVAAMTAATISFLNVPRDHPFLAQAVRLFGTIGPQRGDLYGLYYGTLTQFHAGGAPWRRWNGALIPLVLRTQEKAGRDAGSFPPAACRWGEGGGRVYTTAMAALTLEVYYRYLPAYEEIRGPYGSGNGDGDPPEAPGEILELARSEENKGAYLTALALYEHLIERFPGTPAAAGARDSLERLDRNARARFAFEQALAAAAAGNTDHARHYLGLVVAETRDEKLASIARALLSKLPPPRRWRPEDDGPDPGAGEPPPPLPPSPAAVRELREKILRFEEAGKAALSARRREVLARVAAAEGKHSDAFMGPWREVLSLYGKAGLPAPESGAFEPFYLTEEARRVWHENQGARAKLGAEEFRYLLLLNDYRQRLGLNPLRADLQLVAACRGHSEEMARLNYFSHGSPVPENDTPWKRAQREGTTAHGEVLFMGRTRAREALEAWRFSPGHHKILLLKSRRLGVGRHSIFWTSLQGP